MAAPTIADVLAQAARGLPGDEARADAEILLARALGQGRSWLYAHSDDPFPDALAPEFGTLLARRARGEPVAYILGSQAFWSMRFSVTSDTLIPRPETELLVELALQRLPMDQARRVLDLGTGSGAIAIAIARERTRAELTAIDQNARALAVARKNAARLVPDRIRFLPGSWFSPVQGERFDLIVSNPPYIAERDPHLSMGDLRFEPGSALVAGVDGLDCIRAIVGDARRFLAPGAWLLIEHGQDQGAQVRTLLMASGLAQVVSFVDLEQRDRVSGGCEPGVNAAGFR